MGIREVLAAPRSPWQNPFAERLVGSIRRECLDHVIVFHEAGLRRILKDYFEYYERCRTHLSLEKDAPVSRPVELPSLGQVIEIPKVGGLHHLHSRKAACLKLACKRSCGNAERAVCPFAMRTLFFVAGRLPFELFRKVTGMQYE